MAALPPMLSPTSAAGLEMNQALYQRPWRGTATGAPMGLFFPMPSSMPGSARSSAAASGNRYAEEAARLMGPPSHKVRRARSKASAISQAYIPVGRNELRQLVRMRAVPVPSQGLQEPSSMEQQGSAELCEQHQGLSPQYPLLLQAWARIRLPP